MGRAPGHHCTAKINYSNSLRKAPALQSQQLGLGLWQLLVTVGMKGSCVKPLQPLPCLAMEQKTGSNLWKTPPRPWVHPGAANSPDTHAAALAQGLTQKQCHQPTSCEFPCTTQPSSCSREFQFLSCVDVFFHLFSCSQDTDLAAVLRCASTARRWGPENAEPGFYLLAVVHHWGQPLHRAVETLGCCYETASENAFVPQ